MLEVIVLTLSIVAAVLSIVVSVKHLRSKG